TRRAQRTRAWRGLLLLAVPRLLSQAVPATDLPARQGRRGYEHETARSWNARPALTTTSKEFRHGQDPIPTPSSLAARGVLADEWHAGCLDDKGMRAPRRAGSHADRGARKHGRHARDCRRHVRPDAGAAPVSRREGPRGP